MTSPANTPVLPRSAETEVPILALEGFLPYRLNVLATEVSQALARAYGKKFGISIPEWRALATLGQFGTITARDIGQHSRMHKTTVSRAIAALEQRQLVVRTTNKTDMREAFLTMSNAGHAIYAQIVPMAHGFSDRLCEGLSSSEKHAFEAVLTKLLLRVSTVEMMQDNTKPGV